MKKYVAVIVLALAVYAAMGIYQEKLLRMAGTYISPNDPLVHADAIAVLAGGSPARMLEAIDLVNKGNWADRIVLTRGPEPKIAKTIRERGLLLQSDPEYLKKLAAASNIPPAAVTVLEPVANSTFDEAGILLDYMLKNRKTSLIVVSSPYHTRRIKFIFGEIFAPHQITVMAHGTPYEDFNQLSWWKNRQSLRDVIFEYQKYLFYRIFYSLEKSRRAALAAQAAKTEASVPAIDDKPQPQGL